MALRINNVYQKKKVFMESNEQTKEKKRKLVKVE